MRNDIERSLMTILLIAMSAIFWAKGYPTMETKLEFCQIELAASQDALLKELEK